MKKKHFGIFAYQKKINHTVTLEDYSSDLDFFGLASTQDILENAWENLPADFSTDERFMFLELAEQMIKFDDQTESYTLDEENNAN